jgi:hypothetical protein
VNPSLCLSILVAFSLLSGELFARSGQSSPTNNQNPSIAVSSSETNSSATQTVIPGPQRSFLRMAGISQKIAPEEVLPLLSRNVFTQGYQGSIRPTEFLILLKRYVVQARELAALAASNGMVLHVTNCDDAKPLLHILGYRARADCGDPKTSLQTEDPERAFLSIDSGFPLPDLEQTLQGGKSFEYSFTASNVPVLFTESDWTTASLKNFKENSRDLLDTILSDPEIARLYWALSRLDPETSSFLQQSIGIGKLLPYAGVLDFYGKSLCISGGRVSVPGGPAAEAAWKDLVGADPASPAAFVLKLLAKDKGWLMAYFDALSRVHGNRQAYFTDPHRLRFFYAGLRAPDPSVPATRGSFRPAPALLQLVTRLQLDSSGKPVVPGNLETWRDIVLQWRNSKFVRRWKRQASKVNDPDDLVQTMFALSRMSSDGGPLQIYMATSELDSRRSHEHNLAPETVRLLANKFEGYSDQYRLFSEFPELSDESIALFLDIAQELNAVPSAVRANALGIFQANVGIWQILARQGQILSPHLNDSWQQVIKPFATIRSGTQLYEAGRTSLEALVRSSTGKARASQDEIVDLLAGPRQNTPQGRQIHREIADRMRALIDDQRLVSLDTLLTLGDALTDEARGKRPADYVITLSGQTREFEMPRPIFTNGERSEWAAGIYNNHHTDAQMRTNLPKILKSPTATRAQIDEALSQLSSFLRDTLVGLNYAYYEPPGAQALHNNPLLVRSHDFVGDSVGGIKTLWQAPNVFGAGSPAGGGAHFVGSLVDLPYALASLEQDFISPHSVQALIWNELTPELLAGAVLPRWWNISPLELHAIALYQRSGEELLTASAKDEALRNKVVNILSDRLFPQQLRRTETDLRENRVSEALARMMPADTFYLAAEFQHESSKQDAAWGTAFQELQELCRQHPDQVNWKRLSHDFGTPHPALAQNYGLELLGITPMPAFSGSSSRFMAESWDSPNLYWARLADEGGYAPVLLNQLVPELTRMMVEKVFATDLEDWPALLRAMHETGADLREGKLTAPPKIREAQN